MKIFKTILSLSAIFIFSASITLAGKYILYGDIVPVEENNNLNLGGSVIQVDRGGTGSTSFTAGECLVGNGTGAITTQACGGGGDYDVLGQATSTLSIHTSTYNHSNYDTAYGWGNHSGLYDILGQATSSVNIHEATYNHSAFWDNLSDITLAQGNIFVGNGSNNPEASSTIRINENSDIYLSKTGYDSPKMFFQDADAESFNFQKTSSRVDFVASDVDTAFYFFPNGDYTDYFGFHTLSNIPTITAEGSYLRIGDSFLTSHAIASSSDLLINGICEVDGIIYADGGVIGNLTGTSSDTASDSLWTDHNNYPAACGAGEYVSAIGDTLTCSAPSGTGYSSIAEINADLAGESVASTTHSWDISDYTNLAVSTGIDLTDDTLSFDCSDVDGNGISCSGEELQLDITNLGADTLADADKFVFYDDTGGANDSITWANLLATLRGDYNSIANLSARMAGETVASTTASVGGEVSGTINNITINNDALDDQYYDSEADLTTLLDNNYQPLEATLTDIADGTIAENLVNTANPWADNEVANTLTVTMVAGSTIPNGTAPVCDADGEICHDTTDNQIILDNIVIPTTNTKIWSATIASTSPAFIKGGLLKIPTELDGYTMTRIRCSVQGGTSKVIAVEDESTNSTEDITCGTSVTSDDGSITNATVTAAEEMFIDFGATTGAVNYVSISVFGNWTRE